MNLRGKREKRIRRHRRVRAKIAGTGERPRLSVFRSSRHISAQLIDDRVGRTIAAARDTEADRAKKAGGKSALLAGAVGELIAVRAREKKITHAVFDRAGYRYHGSVKALAEGARKGGLIL